MSLNVPFMLKEWPKISSQRRGSLVSHSKRLVVSSCLANMAQTAVRFRG